MCSPSSSLQGKIDFNFFNGGFMRAARYFKALAAAMAAVGVMVGGVSAQTKSVKPAPSVSTFKDSRDGKAYRKITIGKQTWMAENLNYDANGSKCYEDNADSCAKYGRLYNWETAMNGASSSSSNPSRVRGVCSVGWHLPSDEEWSTLVSYVERDGNCSSCAGRRLKSTSGWYNNGNGDDNYGFAALPGGGGSSGGDFGSAGDGGYWWSATEGDAYYAWYRGMYYIDEYVGRGSYDKSYLFSVRCVAD
jgi:uncharacterized protein (TIGR02145 family)